MHSRFLTMTLFPVMGLMLAAAGPAAAQSRVFGNAPAAYGRDDYRAPYADAQRSAFDNGYRDGRKRGEQAARDNRPFDVQRERDYRNAEAGYNRSLGDRNRYRDNYRGGFTQGYRAAAGTTIAVGAPAATVVTATIVVMATTAATATTVATAAPRATAPIRTARATATRRAWTTSTIASVLT
jgi:hypothetical protein